MSDENASKTLRVSPVSKISQGSGAVLPDPASTQAASVSGVPQGQDVSDELHDLAQKTVKLAPPTRTGFQRPSPAPVAVPEAVLQPSAPKPAAINLHAPSPVSAAVGAPKAPEAVADSQGQAQVRTIARQTIKLAPPTRTGSQRPTPAASASPETDAAPASDANAKSSAKAPTLNLDFAALKAGAKRTQTVNAPFAEKAPMSQDENQSGQEEGLKAPASAGAPTFSEAAGLPGPKGPTIQLKSPASPKKSVPNGENTGSGLSPKGPTIQLKKPEAENEKTAAPAVKAPALQLKKPAAAGEGASEGASPKGPILQLKTPAAGGETSSGAVSPKAPTIQAEKIQASAAAEKTPAVADAKPLSSQDVKKAEAEKSAAVSEELPESGEAEAPAEPGIVFTILSAVSLVVLLLSIYVLLAQYSAIWLEGFHLPFPGLK